MAMLDGWGVVATTAVLWLGVPLTLLAIWLVWRWRWK